MKPSGLSSCFASFVLLRFVTPTSFWTKHSGLTFCCWFAAKKIDMKESRKPFSFLFCVVGGKASSLGLTSCLLWYLYGVRKG